MEQEFRENNAQAYLSRANGYLEKGNYYGAIPEYTAAIRLDPDNGEAYVGRGGAYFKTGSFDEAVKDCTEAIRLDPNNASVYYTMRGQAYSGDGFINNIVNSPRNNFARSIEDFTSAIRLDPNNATAYFCRGCIYCYMRKFDQAIADCYAALKIEPDNAEAKLILKLVREQKRGRLSILGLLFSFAVLVVFNLIFKNGGAVKAFFIIGFIRWIILNFLEGLLWFFLKKKNKTGSFFADYVI
jgi:tetratricopeptide (TPR) repeat protein